jgi:hypothetical protein
MIIKSLPKKISLLVVTSLLLVVSTLTSCGQSKQVLILRLFLYDVDSFKSGCYQGNGGYSDIRDGMSVTLKNSKGEIIEIGSMRLNRLGINLSSARGERLVDVCNYNYRFEGIPTNTESYVVVIGGGNRGEVVYSKAQLEAAKPTGEWEAEMSLGD